MIGRVCVVLFGVAGAAATVSLVLGAIAGHLTALPLALNAFSVATVTVWGILTNV